MVVSHVGTEEGMLSLLTEAERNKLRSLLTKIAVPPLEDV
jgi:hypothetical protein